MAKKTKIILRKYTPAEQFYFLKTCPIAKGSGKLYNGRFSWVCKIRPTPFSREYDIRITFRLNESPKVTVVAPDLPTLAEGRELPHVYKQNPPQLCLYVPKYREWAAEKKIATTVVPWIYSWLSYFEDWLVTDEWKGGGLHP